MPLSDSDTHSSTVKASICRDALLASCKLPTTLNLRVTLGSSRDPWIPNNPSELINSLKLKHASPSDIIINPSTISPTFNNIEIRYNVTSYKQVDEVLHNQRVECMWSNVRIHVSIGRFKQSDYSLCKGLADLIKSDIKSSSVNIKGTPNDDHSLIKVWIPITATPILSKLYRITLKPNNVCMRVVSESKFIYNLFNTELDIDHLLHNSSSSSSSSSSSTTNNISSSMQQTCTNCWCLTTNIQQHKLSPCLRKCPLCKGYCDRGHCQNHVNNNQYVCRLCGNNHKTIACYQLHWSFSLREHHLKLLSDNLALLKPSSPFSSVSSSYAAAFEKTSSLEQCYHDLSEKFKKLSTKTELLEDTISSLRHYITNNLDQNNVESLFLPSLPSKPPPPLIPSSPPSSPSLLPQPKPPTRSCSPSSSPTSPSSTPSSSSSPSPTSSTASSQSATSTIDISAASSSKSSNTSSSNKTVTNGYNLRSKDPHRSSSSFSFKFPDAIKSKNRS